MRHARDAIVGIDARGRITDWNSGAERLYERDAASVLGQPLELLFPPDRRSVERELLERVLGGATLERETERLRADGSRVAVDLSWSPIVDDAGRVTGVAEIGRDSTGQRMREQQLSHEATHDYLTGLPNRRAFAQELARAVGFSRRYLLRGALIVLDVDRFKVINDTRGHAAGDAALRRVARLLTRRLRTTDFVARIGGDEFAVILPGVDATQAFSVAGELLAALREDRHIGQPLPASAGLVLLDESARMDAEELLALADAALYEAKRRGRDRIVVSHTASASGRGAEQLRWIERIETALGEGGFLVLEQPICDLASDHFDHAELLLRLRPPQGEPVPPSVFLPVAEGSGQIRAIDEWVLEHALARLPETDRALHLNLGAGTLRNRRALEWIATRLALADVPAGRLHFEIPERLVRAEGVAVRAVVERLGDLGCGTVLDDAVAGPGCLAALRRMPFSAVKLRGDALHRATHSAPHRSLVETLVQAAHTLDRRVYACAVENAATLELLAGLGVDHAQGNYLARPGAR